VLRILATARQNGLGLAEISMHAELTRPTTHRILSVLVAEGIVEQRCSTRRYMVGEQIPLLALSRRTRDPLLEIIRPHLRAAVTEIGDTGFLTRRAGFDTVCVARQLGTYPIQVLAWDVGDRRPLGVTNAGIAIKWALGGYSRHWAAKFDLRFSAQRRTSVGAAITSQSARMGLMPRRQETSIRSPHRRERWESRRTAGRGPPYLRRRTLVAKPALGQTGPRPVTRSRCLRAQAMRAARGHRASWLP
jgi:hypothetical protein